MATLRILKEGRKAVRLQPWKSAQIQHNGSRLRPRPRFPLQWLDAAEDPVHFEKPTKTALEAWGVAPASSADLELAQQGLRAKGFRRSAWLLLLLMASGLAFAVYAIWQTYGLTGAPRFAPPHSFWVEGTIDTLGATHSARPTLTLVTVTGRASTVELDFNRTSVFHRGGMLTIAHLKPGQQVNLIHERGLARSIDIMRQPTPALAR